MAVGGSSAGDGTRTDVAGASAATAAVVAVDPGVHPHDLGVVRAATAGGRHGGGSGGGTGDGGDGVGKGTHGGAGSEATHGTQQLGGSRMH